MTDMQESQTIQIWERITQREQAFVLYVDLHFKKLSEFIMDYAEDLRELARLSDEKFIKDVGAVKNICAYLSERAVKFDWCSAKRVHQILPPEFKQVEFNPLKYDYPDEFEQQTKEKEVEKISSLDSSLEKFNKIYEKQTMQYGNELDKWDKEARDLWVSVCVYDCPDHTILTDAVENGNTLITKIEDQPQYYSVDSYVSGVRIEKDKEDKDVYIPITAPITEPQKEDLYEIAGLVEAQREELDSRYDIIFMDAIRYNEAVIIRSIKVGAEKFHQFIKTTHELSTKQIGKFLKGKSHHSPFNPKDPVDAIKKGFCGKPCPSCGSLRWEEKVNSLFPTPTSFFKCYHCGHKIDAELPAIKDE